MFWYATRGCMLCWGKGMGGEGWVGGKGWVRGGRVVGWVGGREGGVRGRVGGRNSCVCCVSVQVMAWLLVDVCSDCVPTCLPIAGSSRVGVSFTPHLNSDRSQSRSSFGCRSLFTFVCQLHASTASCCSLHCYIAKALLCFVTICQLLLHRLNVKLFKMNYLGMLQLSLRTC